MSDFMHADLAITTYDPVAIQIPSAMLDEEPPFLDVYAILRDAMKRDAASTYVRSMWGEEALARFAELVAGGMDLDAALDAIDTEWMARPSKIVGILALNPPRVLA